MIELIFVEDKVMQCFQSVVESLRIGFEINRMRDAVKRMSSVSAANFRCAKEKHFSCSETESGDEMDIFGNKESMPADFFKNRNDVEC